MTKLVLHFDINGTITPVDTTEIGTTFSAANMVISKSVYGKDHSKADDLNLLIERQGKVHSKADNLNLLIERQGKVHSKADNLNLLIRGTR